LQIEKHAVTQARTQTEKHLVTLAMRATALRIDQRAESARAQYGAIGSLRAQCFSIFNLKSAIFNLTSLGGRLS
jgi:hypothetical protein